MKNIILFASFLPTMATASINVFEARVRDQVQFIHEEDTFVEGVANGFKTRIEKKTCSSPAFKFLKLKIEKLSKSSLPYKGPDGIEVKIESFSKTVAPDSPLGKYSQNLSQHLITLKREVEITCNTK